MTSKQTRRVSFSDRVHYSDDASESTVSTDDEFDQDDGSFLNSDDEDDSSVVDDKAMDSDDEELDSDDDDGGSLDSISDYVEADGDDEEEEKEEEEEEDDDEKSQDADDEEMEDEPDDSEEVSKNEAVEAETTEGEENEEEKMTDDCHKEEEHVPLKSYYDVKDEPPLSFRDTGVTERPTDFLGGYGPEACLTPTRRVKLRKSWVANAKAEEEEADYNEFEAWKKARAKEAADRKARVKEASAKKQAGKKAEQDETAKPEQLSTESDPNKNDDESLGNQPSTAMESEVSTEKTVEVAAKPGSILKKSPSTEKQMVKPASILKSKPSSNDEVTLEETEEAQVEPTAGSTKKRKSALKKAKKSKGEPNDKKEPKREMPVKKAKAKATAAPTRVIKPRPKDPETVAHEKEVLELKEQISKLERKLDTIEVRTISQLADLEEETAKRMREYRAKADEIVRKQKAKNEKQALKQKSMKTQDVIAQLRKSNQKLRAEGIKIQSAIAKLKESNQVLEEKNSVHRGYASEFLDFQKIEVGLAEEMNKSLNQDLPKYEKLVRSMEDGVTDRVKSGHVERKAKELYEDCIDSMVEMLEESSSDPALLDKVASLMEGEDTDEEEATKENRLSLSGSSRGSSSLARRASDTSNGKIAAPKKSSLKRAVEATRATVSPTKSTVRRSNSLGGKKTPKKEETKRRSSSRDSFRSTRAPRKSSIKVVSDTDDSSVTSMTSMMSATSAASGNFSITDYAY